MTVNRDKAYRQIPEGMLRKLFDHQQWLTTDGRAGKQLEGRRLDFTECMLDGVDFSHANIPEARFNWSSLRQGRFVGAHMERADMMWGDVEGANFSHANLKKASLPSRSYLKAEFAGAETTGVSCDMEYFESPLEAHYRVFCQQHPDWEANGGSMKKWYASPHGAVVRARSVHLDASAVPL